MRLLLFVAILFTSAASAQAPLVEQANAAYDSGDFAAAARLYTEALRSGDRDGSVAYNAACSFALDGQTDMAFARLGEAVQFGFSNASLAQTDTDLDSIRDDARWSAALAAIQANAEAQARLWESPALRSPFREALSEDEKTAGLSTLWAEARYGFANFDLVPDLDWDSLYVATLPLVRAPGTTADYYGILQGVVAQLKDGHSNVNVPRELLPEVYARPGIRTRLVEDRVVVIETSDAVRGVSVGDEVLAIDGVPVRDYARARVRPFRSASTEHSLDVQTYEYALLAGNVADPVALTLRDAAGSTAVRTLPRLTLDARREAFPEAPAFSLDWLPGRVAYVHLNSFGTDEAADGFLAAFDEISTAAALILDVRENGGGNSGVGAAILATLTDTPFQTSTWQVRDYRAAYRAWSRPEGTTGETAGTWAAGPERHYAGPVVVLTSARTFSAAEDFAVAFDVMDRGPMIGEPTGGSTGQPLVFALPGGGSARICAKRDRYPDGTEFVGVGVLPDVDVRASVEDVRAGRDPVLLMALRRLGAE